MNLPPLLRGRGDPGAVEGASCLEGVHRYRTSELVVVSLTPRAEDAHNLVAGNHLDLGDAVGIPAQQTALSAAGLDASTVPSVEAKQVPLCATLT